MTTRVRALPDNSDLHLLLCSPAPIVNGYFAVATESVASIISPNSFIDELSQFSMIVDARIPWNSAISPQMTWPSSDLIVVWYLWVRKNTRIKVSSTTSLTGGSRTAQMRGRTMITLLIPFPRPENKGSFNYCRYMSTTFFTRP